MISTVPDIQPDISLNRLTSWRLAKDHIYKKKIAYLKYAIWLYFYLIIFEGALRKWVLPQLANPLLLIRDPIVLWILFYSIKNGFLKINLYVIVLGALGTISFFATMIFGHGSVPVAIYGLRIIILHFPLMFVIGSIFTKKDVIKLGRVIMILAIPMTILIGMQFYSPQNAWVNRGVGGDETGAGFSGALGYFRPPGTFSFTSGNTLFYSLVAAYLFFFWFNLIYINRLLLVCATVALILAIPFSISRSLVFQTILSILFAFFTLVKKPKQIRVVLLASFGLLVFFLIFQQQSFFATAIDVLSQRFTNADANEGGVQGTLIDRFFGDFLRSFNSINELPYWGYGIGMGTQVGSVLLTGSHGWLIAENETGRVFGEMGFLLGLFFLLTRLTLAFQIVTRSLIQVFRKDNSLPWILLSFGFLQIIQGQWGQATTLGFGALIGGLLLASLKPDIESSAIDLSEVTD